MKDVRIWKQELREGAHAARLASLYCCAPEDTAPQAARYAAALDGLEAAFGPHSAAALFSAPGRTEIGGNHTDHQHGRVLAGSVNIDMIAAAGPNGLNQLRVQSEGYPLCAISLDDLAPRKEEENSSAAILRGECAAFAQRGARLSGLDVYVTSNVPKGSGVSSSAAYEVLIGTILNELFMSEKVSPIAIAQIGQWTENVYFGKPCGLMDQMGASVGGAVAIDFQDPASPVVRRADYDFSASGHALCIVDTASSHGDLTDDYADITREMGAVAAYFGQRFLRDVPEKDFRAALPALRQACGDRAVLRALHYYADDRRAVEEAEALETGDFPRFLALVNDSGLSSALHLQNTWSIADPRQQAIPVALAVGRELLGGTGAIRVHGGGFAGTIQAFVPNEKLAGFKAGMEALLGAGKCHVLHIRPQGGTTVIG